MGRKGVSDVRALEGGGEKKGEEAHIPEFSLKDGIVEVGRLLVVFPVRPGQSVGSTEAELPAKANRRRVVVSSLSVESRDDDLARNLDSLSSSSSVGELPGSRLSAEKCLAVVSLKSPDHRVVELSLSNKETSGRLTNKEENRRSAGDPTTSFDETTYVLRLTPVDPPVRKVETLPIANS